MSRVVSGHGIYKGINYSQSKFWIESDFSRQMSKGQKKLRLIKQITDALTYVATIFDQQQTSHQNFSSFFFPHFSLCKISFAFCTNSKCFLSWWHLNIIIYKYHNSEMMLSWHFRTNGHWTIEHTILQTQWICANNFCFISFSFICIPLHSWVWHWWSILKGPSIWFKDPAIVKNSIFFKGDNFFYSCYREQLIF